MLDIKMNKIGTFSNIYDIYVYTDDYSQVPHFHILDNRNPNNRLYMPCIEITRARYFDYMEGQCMLNPDELTKLMAYLKEQREGCQVSNWEFLCMTWEANNTSRIPKKIYDHISDYTDLWKE